RACAAQTAGGGDQRCGAPRDLSTRLARRVDGRQRRHGGEEPGPLLEGGDEAGARDAVLGGAGGVGARVDAVVHEGDPGAAVLVHLHVDEVEERAAAAGPALAAHDGVAGGVHAGGGDGGLLGVGAGDDGEVAVPRLVVEGTDVVGADVVRVARRRAHVGEGEAAVVARDEGGEVRGLDAGDGHVHGLRPVGARVLAAGQVEVPVVAVDEHVVGGVVAV